MKNILSILLISVLFIGCSENRVLIDDLTLKKIYDEDDIYNTYARVAYYEGKLFTGLAFDICRNGKIKEEINYFKGRKDGMHTKWFCGSDRLEFEKEFKNGLRHGLWKVYSPAGDWPSYEKYYEMGHPTGLYKHWDEESGNITWEGHWDGQTYISDKCYRNGVLVKCED